MPLTLSQQQLVKRVRSLTTDSTTDVSDDQILYFAGQGATDATYTNNVIDGVLDYYGVIADVWTYLARADRYMAESEGSVSVSQPVAMKWAAYYRSLSAGGLGGTPTITFGQTQRLDLITTALDGEEFGV